MNQTAAPARQYYPALDGLRGVAILLVVIYHNFGFANYFFFGWLGVDLFFVLSGFLITNILLNTVYSKNYLKNFYIRRVLRIFPLYYSFLLVCFFIISFIYVERDLSYYVKNQLWFWLYLQNWLFVIKLPPNNILIHLWSLAVEEQFYLLWPFIVLWIKSPKKLLEIVLCTLLIVISCRFFIWTYKIEKLSYFSLYTFTRIDGICVGCLIALLQRISNSFLEKYTTLIILALAGINFLFYFFNRDHEFSFPYLAIVGYSTFAVIFGLLVYEASTEKTKIINWIFNIKVLKFFGLISYSFYVFHWPVYILLKSPLDKLFSSSFKIDIVSLQILTSIIATGLAILISYLNYKYFESYFLKLKTKYANTN